MTRAARALAHLGEVDATLAVLALWCRHRDGAGVTRTEGDVITYGPGFDRLALPEQVGLLAHHVLHVALRHSARQAGLAERLGAGFDASLFGLAADGIINQVLVLAGHAIPRPAVLLTDLLAEAGLPAQSPVAALQDWDVDRLALALHRAPDRARRLRDWGKARGFQTDLASGPPSEAGKGQSEADWRNHLLRAFEAGRKAGSGIGRLGAVLADLSRDGTPWERLLRGLLAQALAERPRPSWKRPAGHWVARLAEAEARGGPVPVFAPGRQRQNQVARLVIGLDTSLSIDALTLDLFAAEAQAIARRSRAEAHLLAFDETVFATTRLDPAGWERLRLPELRRGGGTDYHDLFRKAGALGPSILVVLTDLDAPLPPAPRFPLLWAVIGPAQSPGYGKVLRLDQG